MSCHDDDAFILAAAAAAAAAAAPPTPLSSQPEKNGLKKGVNNGCIAHKKEKNSPQRLRPE